MTKKNATKKTYAPHGSPERKQQVSLWLTPAEKNDLGILARSAGCSPSAYVGRLVHSVSARFLRSSMRARVVGSGPGLEDACRALSAALGGVPSDRLADAVDGEWVAWGVDPLADTDVATAVVLSRDDELAAGATGTEDVHDRAAVGPTFGHEGGGALNDDQRGR